MPGLRTTLAGFDAGYEAMAGHESEDVADKAKRSAGAKTFLCPVAGCNLKFSRAQHLEQHAASHSRDKRFVCDDCGKIFFHAANLRDHFRYHADLSRDLPCSECGAVLKGKRALANHNASRHCTAECPTCGLKMSRAALKRHTAKEHNASEKKSHKCEACQKCFSAMRALMLHKRTHEDNGRASGRIRVAAFPCSDCKRAFGSAEDLKKHLVSAHEEVPCPDCGKTTKNLARHAAYVHSTKYAAKLVRTECPHPGCGKAYASVYAAKYHFEKCHSEGDGRVSARACCDVCGKHVTSLSRHRREVHEENRFECAECGNFFPVRASLERHVRTVHNGERLACPYCEVEVVHLENHLAIVHAMARSDAKQIVEQRTGKASARTDLQWTAFAE